MFFGSDRARLASLEQRSERIETLLERLDVALTVRDPGSARSAEAYDGLRKTVAASAGDRRRLTVTLVDLHDRLARGIALDDLQSVVEEWVLAAGLRRDAVGDEADAFDVVGGEGDSLHVLQPAWIDDVSGVVVRRGQAERVQSDAEGDDEEPAYADEVDELEAVVVEEGRS